jgi:hypothetical protein
MEGSLFMQLARIGLLVVVGVLLVAPCRAQVTQRVSLSSRGGEGNGGSYYPSTSADGRYVAFQSAASNLVPGDTNGALDIFVYDRQLGTTELVSVSSSGTIANADNHYTSMSADGRYVAFQSYASNLVAGDTNGVQDVFVRDRQLGTTELVSVTTGGAQGDADSGGWGVAISANGRYVVFTSAATNLVPGDTNGSVDVFLRDRQLGTTERVSVSSGGIEGNLDSTYGPKITPDGRFVVFRSLASNLVAGDTNGVEDIFVRDRQSGTTERVSVATGGGEGNAKCGAYSSISADGRYVAFHSDASNLVAGDTNGASDVFVHDRQSGTTTCVSVDGGGMPGDSNSFVFSITDDGRYVAFYSTATNLVAGDTNGKYDIFVRDQQTSTTTRVSVDSSGAQANDDSDACWISTDGRYVAFESIATNLVAGDGNGAFDIFVHDRQSGTTERVSVDGIGLQGNSGSNSAFHGLSANGRFAAFTSTASNLVPGDTNGQMDIFVRDMVTGTTDRVSVDSSGAQANGDSYAHSISADGRFVSFESDATNLAAGDTNGNRDLYVRDRQNGTTVRASVDSNGVQGNSEIAYSSISADGRYVAFQSNSTNLVPGDTNNRSDVFVHDLQTGTTERASVDSSGNEANGDSGYSDTSLSADGRYVAFMSSATNLVPGDTNGLDDIFVRDRLNGTTERVSVDSSGAQANGGSYNVSLSSDGRFVVFSSYATNLVPGDTNAKEDVFVRDRQNGTTERVSVDSGGVQGNQESDYPSISGDGRYVMFSSSANNLVPGDTNGTTDVFVRDRLLGTTERVSVGPGGAQANGGSDFAQMTTDGRFVLFESTASNLVTGDTNGFLDVFIRDRNASGFTSVCEPGTGGVIACPCGNPPSGSGRGCNNSAGTGGASLTASGIAYLTMDSLVFTTSGELPTAMSILVQGTSITSGAVYGRGVRCIGSALTQLYVKAASGGSVTAPDFGAGDPRVSLRSAALGDMIQPGESRWYFVMYRDPLGACPRSAPGLIHGYHTFNATQTGRIDWSL